MHEGALALIFARESIYDPRQGDRSPEEQIEEGVAWCEREGVKPLYIDGTPGIMETRTGGSRHSRSAKRGRPKWERAKRIMRGEDPTVPKPDILVTWSSSRRGRRLDGYVELRDICAEHQVLWCINGRLWDMTSPNDRAAMGHFAVEDERQADQTNEDVRRAINKNAVNGQPHGRILFGYRRVYDERTGKLLRQEINPAEAEVVRRMFDMHLSGHGCRTIARTLNNEGITTRQGAKWKDAQVRRHLANPAYAGRRVHQGQVLEGKEAKWDAIIDPERFDRVQARLAAGRTRVTYMAPMIGLLVGTARCGRCGAKMGRIHDRNQRRVYACMERYHVSRDQRRLDAWVIGAVLKRLALPDVDDILAGTVDPEVEQAQAVVDQLQAELDEAMGLWKAKRISATRFAEMEEHLLPQIAEAKRQARKAALPLEIDSPADGDWDAWWDRCSAEQRRETVRALIVSVVVHPLGSGRRNYRDEEYTTINWR